MPTQRKIMRNYLLASLSQESLACLLPDLEEVTLNTRQVLYDTEKTIRHVYFPGDGMILLFQTFEDGMQAEVGMIGKEGMIGQSVLSSIDTSFTEALVQVPGKALRMQVANFKLRVKLNPEFGSILLSYSESLRAQMMQVAACNAHHSLRQRLVRLLLMTQDRIQQADLPVTQTLLASMLSVQRPSVTIAAAGLQRVGLIKYSQGNIKILSRIGLEAACCECYGKIRARGSWIYTQEQFRSS